MQAEVEEVHQLLVSQQHGLEGLMRDAAKLEARLLERRSSVALGLDRASREVFRLETLTKSCEATLASIENGSPWLAFSDSSQPAAQSTSRCSTKETLEGLEAALSSADEVLSRVEGRRGVVVVPKRPRAGRLSSWLENLAEVQTASKLAAAQIKADAAHLDLNEALSNLRQG